MVARRVGAESGTRQLLMLHGIYGRGRNWLAVARTLVERRPDWRCWLADMRHHGDAHAGPEAGTLDALAGDIETWGAEQGVQPDAVLGHSFGGKVALAYAGRQTARAGHLGLQGDRDAAAREYALVVPELADLGMVLEQALVVLDMALVLGPDSPLVQARVPEARAIFERLGAKPYLERLDSLLTASSTPPAASPKRAALEGAPTG